MFKQLIAGLTVVALLAIAIVAFAPSITTQVVSADAVADACEGIGLTGADCNKKSAGNSLSNVISTIINILSAIIGAVAVIMVIISGLRYVTSAGDAQKVSTAKSTLIYAIVGLVIVAVAQILVRFVFNTATR